MTQELDIYYTVDKTVSKTSPLEFHKKNAATDLRSSIDWVLMPNETKLVTTSHKMIIPEGYCGIISSRSGLALKHSIFVLNSVGLIDPSYRGNIGIILHNASHHQFTIRKDDRVAQIIFMKYEMPNFLEIDGGDFEEYSTERGSNGFGSSGVK